MTKSRAITKAKSKLTGQFDSLGSSGLKRWGKRGQVDEEILNDLRGNRAVKTYRDMRDNDDVVGSVMFAIENILRGCSWSVKGEDDEANQFIEECRLDMRPTWTMFISECLSMLPYGYAPHEVVLKRRDGKNSKFNDGRIGWAGWPLRSQESLQEWEWDDMGNVVAMVQQVQYPASLHVVIPYSRMLLFRTTAHKNNPEGRSILRSAYRSWYMKRKLENLEAIGAERDLAGLPVIYCDAASLSGILPSGRTLRDELIDIVRNVRHDEQEGVILPLAYDENGHQLIKFELLSSGGSRQFDCDKIIQRYRHAIAQTMLADFVLVGGEKFGSRAMADNMTSMFEWAVKAYLEMIAEEINERAIPELFEANGWKPREMPVLMADDIETPGWKEFAEGLSSLAAAGMPLFPDPGLEEYVRKLYKLPDRPEEFDIDIQSEPELPEPEPEIMPLPEPEPKPKPKKKRHKAA